MYCEQTDVDCTFLYADLDEEIYMDQRKGFVRNLGAGEQVVCVLRKSIYGRKQAPHN
jgi:hypothetical protein